MNTYLVPVTKEFKKEFTNIMVVYANSQKDAYFNAKSKEV